MRRLYALALVGMLLALPWVVLPGAPATAEVAAKPGETVVSLVFDDGFKGQLAAAKILADRDMAGTFYINSGSLGYPAYMTVAEVKAIARMRHEIAGHTISHDDLTKLSPSRAKDEICNDRATLDRLGFQVTSFAYPYGANSPAVKKMVQECGYNSARVVSGLYNSPSDCSDCPVGETLPPTDDFRIRTNETKTTLSLLIARVLAAENGGGGWVPLVFHHICVCPDKGEEVITPTDLTTFVDWLSKRPATTSVRTVDEVMGGEFKPVVGQPLARVISAAEGPTADDQPVTKALSKVPAWTVFGYGIGQSQLIATGLIVALTIVFTYRLATRGNRYGR